MSRKQDTGSSAEDLSRKLDQILQRLDVLERSILGKPEYESLATSLQLTRLGIGMYGEPLKIASRLKNAENYLRQKIIAQDEVSRCIIQALAVKGPLNISAIARQTAAMRGKASRHTIRSRVENLVKQGVLTKMDGRIPTYDLVEKSEGDRGTLLQAGVSSVLSNRISTGYVDLDGLLLGGLPKNYAVLLTSPPCDERDLLVERFLGEGLKESQIIFFATSKATGLQDLAEKYQSNFYLFVCNPQADTMIGSLSNVFKLNGVENLTNINIALASAFRRLNDSSPETPRRICLEIISDILLQHHAVQARRWLSALIPELRSEGFTVLAVMDPEMHSPQEARAILDLFDGEINIYEKDSINGPKRYLRIKKMHNQRYSEKELLMRKEGMER